MPKKTHADRRAAGMDVQRTLRGGDIDGVAVAAATEARLGPLGSFVIDFALGEIWTRPGLSRRDRSLVVISILATLNQLNQLKVHVQGGVNHGLSRTEIEEIFVQLGGYAGFPRAIDAMTTARQAIAELQGVERLDANRASMPADILPTSQWKLRQVTQSKLLNTQDGTLIQVQVKTLGRENVRTGASTVPATRYAYSGGLRMNQWFDDRGRWVKGAFTAFDGSTIEYTLQE